MKTILYHGTVTFIAFFLCLSVAKCARAAQWHEMDTCSWARPGASPFTGDKYAAIDAFAIPALDRDVIKRNVEKRQPSSVVRFKRESIVDDYGTVYDPRVTPMFFGANTMCWTPSRAKWKEDAAQYGDVFCSGGYCVAIPYVCGNVTQLIPRSGDGYDGPQAPAGFVPPQYGPGYGRDGPGYLPGRTETFAQWWERWFGGGGGGGGDGGNRTASVPEPSTWVLIVAGLMGIVLSEKRRPEK